MTDHTARFTARTGSPDERVGKPAHRILCLAILLGLLIATPFTDALAAATTEWVSFRPHEGNGRICVRVGENERYYYPLEIEAPLEFTLRGPRRMKMITRHLPEDGEIGDRRYMIVVTRDGKEVLRKEIAAKPSSSSTLCGNDAQVVGAARSNHLTVPEGTHVFRIYVEGDSGPVAVRLFKDRKPKGIAYVPFVPEAHGGICTLIRSSGNAYVHYRASWAKPVCFTVRGPTELVIRTRVDYDPTLVHPGEVPYGVEILRNNEHHEVFYYTTDKATEGEYQETPGVIPGESKRIDLKIPEGTWTIELRPPQADGPTFTTRILIPEDDIGPAARGVN